MATRFRRSFMAKISSKLFICKSFFQLSAQKIPRAHASARAKYRSSGRSSPNSKVLVFGPVNPRGLGKMANFPRSHLLLTLSCFMVLGPQQTHAQELDSAQAMGIYRTIDQWVRQWEVPQDQTELQATLQDENQTPSLACASVTLRLDGQVIGRGQVVYRDPSPQSIIQATKIAIAQARGWVRQKHDGEPSDDLWLGIASRMTLSVELADRVVPMSPSALGLPDLGLSPGVDGLVMRLGEQSEIMSPDEMITLGFDPEQSAYSMATALSSDGAMALASVAELIERGYTFGRFKPIWIAQQGAGKGAVFLDRGGRMIEESSVGVQSVRDMGERIAHHLIAQRWPGSERYGMVGTRDIISGRANPEIAPPYEQALVAIALLRFAGTGDKAIHTQSHDHALKLLNDLGAVQPGESNPWDNAIDAAACVIALSYVDQSIVASEDDLVTLQSRCRATLAKTYTPVDGFLSSFPEAAKGLIAWAMVRDGNMYASSAVRAVFRETPPGQLVSQMPFLGWADLELAQGSSEVPAAGALNLMRTRMWDHQLTKADLNRADRDFAGAVVFTKSTSVLPTSGNLRPIAMVCSMLGDPRLTPGPISDPVVSSEIRRVALAMRFVDQLVMSESSGFLSRASERSVGGVRASLWEWKVSPASSAIALLAAVEFEQSVQAIGARPMPMAAP